jgi:hypothetical protein
VERPEEALQRRRYSFWINEAQAAALKRVKEAEGITESEQIRQALNDWLKRRGALKTQSPRPRGQNPRKRG